MTSSSGPGRRVGARTAERVDDLQLLGRVLREFGIPDEVVSVDGVGRAWSNRVWSARTTHGHYAVKQLLNPWRDPRWREWLTESIDFERKAIAAGVHAPQVVLDPSGEALVEVSDRTFRVHEWIEAADPCPDGPVTSLTAGAIARDLATMHGLRVAPSRVDVFPTPSTGTCEGWSALVRDLRRVGSSYADEAARVSPAIEQVHDWLLARPQDSGRPVMSHGDVDPKNLLLADGEPWLVDWDVAAPWVPAEETLRTALALVDWREARVARAFLTTYSAASGNDTDLSPELLSTDLIISIDWLDRCLRIASGMQPAERHRVAEAQHQVVVELRRLPERIAIARDLPGWLGSDTPT